jgi:hypothetical protein
MSYYPVGLDLPEMVRENEEFCITVFGRPDSAAVACRIYDVQNGLMVAVPALMLNEGKLSAWVRLSRTGLYRVQISYGNESPLTQLILVLSAATDSDS